MADPPADVADPPKVTPGIQNLRTFDPFADDGDSDDDPQEKDKGSPGRPPACEIHLWIKQRTTRKATTIVQGLPLQYDLKQLCRVLCKELACNGWVC